MKLKSNFSLGLDFKPLQSWPETVPAVALGSYLLCGFSLPEDHPVYEHPLQNSFDHSNVLKSLYPQLTLSEIARLFQTPDFSKVFTPEPIEKAYGFHLTPETQEVLSYLPQTPESFQTLLSQKKWSPQDLHPLLLLPLSSRAFVIEELLSHADSKQESVKRLELLSDLLMMKHSPESLSGMKLEILHQKRYPLTTDRDSAQKKQDLPWLSQIKNQFKRRGDKAGYEVQFFAGTPAELNKMAQNLTRVAEAWNSKS